jgi:hypothetical protein
MASGPTKESAQPHRPTNASRANGGGIEQRRQRDQTGTRNTKKEAGQPHEHNDQYDRLACVADSAEGHGTAASAVIGLR